MQKKNCTSEDIAQLAGVSQSTVSRVFAGSANVSEKKRRKILEVSEKLGYAPNAIARGLSTRKTKMIGIIMHDFRNPFYSDALSKFYARLSAKGYHLIFINSGTEQVQEKEISQLIDYHVEGVIITDALLSSQAAGRFSRSNIAVVFFNRCIERTGCSAVVCDNYQASRQIATYLAGTGHRSFGLIAGPQDTSTGTDRMKGFMEVLQERSIGNMAVVHGDYTFEGGFKCAQELMAGRKKPDCIYCANDITALGAIEAIRAMGLKVPEDVSVMGFDDIWMAGWPSYSLTTWRQPVEEMADRTLSLLTDQLDGKLKAPKIIKVKGQMVLRNSVKTRSRK